MAILEVHHIEKHFGATRVLEDISFEERPVLHITIRLVKSPTWCLNFWEKPEQGKLISLQGNPISLTLLILPPSGRAR